jgi:hypothetical protein
MQRVGHFIICAAAGVLLAVLPHLIMLYETSSPLYVADHDDFLYLSVAAQSYYAHPLSLADPMFQDSTKKSMYPYPQFAPGILGARFLAGSPLWINLFWRVFAGLSIGLAWALLLGEVVQRRSLATCLGVVLLSDMGLLSGHLFIKPALTALELIFGKSGAVLAGNPQLLPQWRIISPGLSLAYLLFFMWALSSLRNQWNPNRLVVAGLSFGMLFYVYFYYWTAAAAALALCFLLDTGRRRTYVWTGTIGGFIGAPALWAGFRLRGAGQSDEWLQRTDNFLPIPHFSELLLPALAIATVVLSFFWIYFRRRQYLPFWSLAVAGLTLANHQIITGLQIQNFHYVYVWGPAVSFLIVLALAETARWAYERRPDFAATVMVTLAVASFCLGVWLRALETLRSRETAEIRANVAAYLNQRRHFGGAHALLPGSVIGGAPEFVEAAIAFEDVRPLNAYAAEFSPAIDNDELGRRIALDAYLTGIGPEEFEKRQRQSLTDGHWGPWARNPAVRDSRLKARVDAFAMIAQDPVKAIRQFSVSYVALAPGQHLPHDVSADFCVLEDGPNWTVWESYSLMLSRRTVSQSGSGRRPDTVPTQCWPSQVKPLFG